MLFHSTAPVKKRKKIQKRNRFFGNSLLNALHISHDILKIATTSKFVHRLPYSESEQSDRRQTFCFKGQNKTKI